MVWYDQDDVSALISPIHSGQSAILTRMAMTSSSIMRQAVPAG